MMNYSNNNNSFHLLNVIDINFKVPILQMRNLWLENVNEEGLS